MIDPLRPEVKASVQACQEAGIHVAMVTGDHPVTALAIARELGFAERPEQVVTGPMLEKVVAQGDQAVDTLIRDARVLARVEPNQKLQIVESLIRLGHFVASRVTAPTTHRRSAPRTSASPWVSGAPTWRARALTSS
jgi:magnesium-transporting ATPase (P-type)